MANLTLPSDWGLYLGDGTANSSGRSTSGTTQSGWDQALAWVRQFDPNAAIRVREDGQDGQYIAFDNSLLPSNAMGGKGILGAANLDGVQDLENYRGPTATDSNLGNIGNSKDAANSLTDRGTWLDIVGPMVVGAFAGAGGLGLLPDFGINAAQAGLIPGSSGTGLLGGANGSWDVSGLDGALSNGSWDVSGIGGASDGPVFGPDSTGGMVNGSGADIAGAPKPANPWSVTAGNIATQLGIDPSLVTGIVDKLPGVGDLAKLPGILEEALNPPGGGGGMGLLGGGGGPGIPPESALEIIRRLYKPPVLRAFNG